MRASRGMGDINPSKMPKGRTTVKKDGNEPVGLYAKGGKVRRMADGGEAEKEQKKPSRLESAAKAIFFAPIVAGSKAAEYGSKITKGRVSPETQDLLWRKSEKIGQAQGKYWKGLAKHAVGLSDSPDEGMKRGGLAKGNWIKNAVKKPGALRASLGVKKGQNIPAGKLAKAAKAPGKLGQRARLAQTFRKMGK